MFADHKFQLAHLELAARLIASLAWPFDEKFCSILEIAINPIHEGVNSIIWKIQFS